MIAVTTRATSMVQNGQKLAIRADQRGENRTSAAHIYGDKTLVASLSVREDGI